MLKGVDVLPQAAWAKCVGYLQSELPPQQFNTWIRPLQADANEAQLLSLAPNRFVKDWVSDKFLPRITELVIQVSERRIQSVVIDIGKQKSAIAASFSEQVSQTNSHQQKV